MAIPDFVFPHAVSPLSDSRKSAAVSFNAKLDSRTVSIAYGKARPVRKAKNLAKMTPSCAWYEAEDRTLPSVSSF